MRSSLSLAALLLLSSHAAHAQSVGLVAGQSTAFTLPATGYTTSLHFDVPAEATRFKVELLTDTPNVDTDLFLRYGNAFSAQNAYGRAQTYDDLLDQSQYHSVGSTGEEFITIGRSNYRPIKAGRWHLSVLNFAAVPVNARLKVEYFTTGPTPVQFDVRFDLPGEGCDVAPWNDVTAASPVGGNPGTTRGAQRRNALLEAVRQLAAGLDSESPISIRACWDDQTVSASGATLAAAAPNDFMIDDRSLVFSNGSTYPPAAFLPEKYAFYSSAPGARLGGSSACRIRGGSCTDVTDMEITFNRRIGEASVLNGAQFYFGYGAVPAGRLDFVGVSVHELGHGLGFLSLVSVQGSANAPQGSKALGRDDIFARQIIDSTSGVNRPFLQLTDAERVSAMTSLSGLSWIDSRAVNSPMNIPTGFPGILMFAPNPIQPGSSLSHLSDYYTGQLMTPRLNLALGSRQLGLAVPMLYAVGWDPQPTTFPVSPAPFAGLWFERDRNGHGIDFQRIYTDAAGFDIYSLIFYTYDNAGNPEWYIGVGPLIDGAFVASLDAAGNSLIRYRYVGGASPQQAVAAQSGQIRIDFNQASKSPACNDGTNRAGAGLLGMMRWTLGGVTGAWCMEELIPAGLRTPADLTGTWFGGAADAGWGSSVATAARPNAQSFLFSTLYYPDSTGAGRWAFVNSENYAPGQVLPVLERRGYCRTCPATAITDTQVGTMTVNLSQPTQGQPGPNRFGFDLTYGGTEGGRFTRSNVPYELLSVPQ